MRGLLLLMIGLSFAAHAEIYKWIDKRGRVQYGEKLPAGATALPMRPEAMPAGKAPAAEDLQRQDADFRRRQLEQQRADELAVQRADARKRNCASARERLSNYETRRRPFRMENGERVFLTDDEREADTARARAQVSQWCD